MQSINAAAVSPAFTTALLVAVFAGVFTMGMDWLGCLWLLGRYSSVIFCSFAILFSRWGEGCV